MVKRLVVPRRRSGRVDDEGNDLLLNSERGAGGVLVVSKEEVAVGRKGSGGAWGSTSRNAGLAGPAPQNGRIRTPAKKTAKRSIVARQFKPFGSANSCPQSIHSKAWYHRARSKKFTR